VTEGDSARACGEPDFHPPDPIGRSSSRDHGPFTGLSRGDRNITFGVTRSIRLIDDSQNLEPWCDIAPTRRLMPCCHGSVGLPALYFIFAANGVPPSIA